MKTNNSQNNLDLVRAIGVELEQGSFREFRRNTDPLMRILHEYAQIERNTSAADANLSTKLWDSIQQNVQGAGAGAGAGAGNISIVQIIARDVDSGISSTGKVNNEGSGVTPIDQSNIHDSDLTKTLTIKSIANLSEFEKNQIANQRTGESGSITIPTGEPNVHLADKKITPIGRAKVAFPVWKRFAVAAVLLLSIWGILQYGSGLLLTDPNAPIAFATTENVKHTLLDGSVVTLRPNSSLYKIEESESRMTYKLEGEALFEVERDGGRMFEIRAGDAVVEVLGTTFSVRDWRDEVEVYVESGRVWVGDVGVTGRGAEARSNGSGQDNGSIGA